MPYKIILAPEAVEDLKTLRAFDRVAVRKAIKEHLSFEPTTTSKSRIKRLRKMRHPQYRLRVEEIRIFYDVTDEVVEVLAIVPKSEATAWLERYGEQTDAQNGPDEENDS
jgi:mRNA-degrading endonuclease RelE of RelBE toxin-antitoxin system